MADTIHSYFLFDFPSSLASSRNTTGTGTTTMRGSASYLARATTVFGRRTGCPASFSLAPRCHRRVRWGTSSSVATDGRNISSSSSCPADEKPRYIVEAQPAPGSPFHYAFPVHDLEQAKDFYGNVLGCAEGRSSTKWQDYSLHGHQIVAHWVGYDYRCQDYYNPVDGDEVPVPHVGLAVTVEQFHDLADRIGRAGIEFIIEPHLRFKNQPGEQYTMFFKDPSGNNLEFKAMTRPENLFAKYDVSED